MPTSITAPEAEQQAVLDYLTDNSIVATKHASGMYYQVVTPGTGTGNPPALCSQIQINYAGKLTNGTVFDQQTSAVFVLGSLIEGWKKGIPLIQKGGQIKLFIPPSLGYGSTDVKKDNVVVIPANSILVFDVSLTDFTAG